MQGVINFLRASRSCGMGLHNSLAFRSIKKGIRRVANRTPGAREALGLVDRLRRLAAVRRHATESGLFGASEAHAICRTYSHLARHTQLTAGGICNLEFLIRRTIEQRIHGSFVECGTWNGGALAYWAHRYQQRGGDPSLCPLFGFDSFLGMPHMTPEDGDRVADWFHGSPAADLPAEHLNGALIPVGKNEASEQTCREVLRESGYPQEFVHIVPGWFQHTLPAHAPELAPVAVLRLDADLYAATRFVLDCLYPAVTSGGAVVIDDYGTFEGCRRATDEFLAVIGSPRLYAADSTVRFFFKS